MIDDDLAELEQDGEDVVSLDELAVDEARDYCPECGRQALGRVCAACGCSMVAGPVFRSGDPA